MLSLILLAALASPARAAIGMYDCTDADAPVGYRYSGGVTCDAGKGTLFCIPTGGTWDCGLSTYAGVPSDLPATGNIVAEYGRAGRYSAWGVGTDGDTFCCQIAAANLNRVELHGGHDDDTEAFFYDDGVTHWDLYSASAGNLKAYMTGEDGDDTMDGSWDNSASYSEKLDGGANVDIMNGNPGDDILCGGLDGDTMTGGADDDVVFGGGGTDHVSGGFAADTDACGNAGDIFSNCDTTSVTVCPAF
jgi:Ca2+-binding RTX toxin-like protein